jgi:hypothetical protein
MATTDLGISKALALPVNNPLPTSWLGRVDMPRGLPGWAAFGALSNKKVKNLLAQIGYDLSRWDYTMISADNKIGRYQFDSTMLESYGLLLPGSVKEYKDAAINYSHCWTSVMVRNSVNTYANYLYDSTSLQGFLLNSIAQDHLAYQYLADTYLACKKSGAIKETDTDEVIAGIIYVGWNLGATGATAWRYHAIGDNGAQAYNTGRYAVSVLSL